jgi:ADP-ribosylglycohydrolase
MNTIDIKNKLKGCLVLGAIGDAIGGRYEGKYENQSISYEFNWALSDDTQLTLATCEAIYNTDVSAEKIAASFLKWFNARKLTGLGASTLKALKELQVGGHWALVGRSGEYAAGNGAAMRIAPLAFKKNVSRQTLHDVCSITHKNDEAYAGALSVYYSICKALTGEWKGEANLIELILEDLPDMLVKDRLIELMNLKDRSIEEVGKKFKPNGYVVDSVPLVVFAAQKITTCDVKTIFQELIKVGGDTDTICSMTGQIVGSLKGYNTIPTDLIEKYEKLKEKELINELVNNWKIE